MYRPLVYACLSEQFSLAVLGRATFQNLYRGGVLRYPRNRLHRRTEFLCEITHSSFNHFSVMKYGILPYCTFKQIQSFFSCQFSVYASFFSSSQAAVKLSPPQNYSAARQFSGRHGLVEQNCSAYDRKYRFQTHDEGRYRRFCMLLGHHTWKV